MKKVMYAATAVGMILFLGLAIYAGNVAQANSVNNNEHRGMRYSYEDNTMGDRNEIECPFRGERRYLNEDCPFWGEEQPMRCGARNRGRMMENENRPCANSRRR